MTDRTARPPTAAERLAMLERADEADTTDWRGEAVRVLDREVRQQARRAEIRMLREHIEAAAAAHPSATVPEPARNPEEFGDETWWMVESDRREFWTGDEWSLDWTEGARFVGEREAATSMPAAMVEGRSWRPVQHGYFAPPATVPEPDERQSPPPSMVGHDHSDCPVCGTPATVPDEGLRCDFDCDACRGEQGNEYERFASQPKGPNPEATRE